MTVNKAVISDDFTKLATTYIQTYQNRQWYIAKHVLMSGGAASVLAAFMLHVATRASCINGKLIGPPIIPVEWHTFVTAVTIMMVGVLCWRFAKRAERDWAHHAEWTQQLVLDLQEGKCHTQTLSLVPDHVLTSAEGLDFDCLDHMLIVPLDQQRTVCIPMAGELDEIRSSIKSEITVSYLPRTELLTSIDFEGDSISVIERFSRHDNDYLAKLITLRSCWFALGQVTDGSFATALRQLDTVTGEASDVASKAQHAVAA